MQPPTNLQVAALQHGCIINGTGEHHAAELVQPAMSICYWKKTSPPVVAASLKVARLKPKKAKPIAVLETWIK